MCAAILHLSCSHFAGKLKSLLGKFKATEDKRIAALEAAKKEVTRIIQMYEDIMLRSDKVEEPG